ncbi:GPP34 family phosphoprotein [Actinoplanes sp. NPDC023714]|uniref:GOLPH3/VPS74 family protein n=1 Tax=Actinoplanes sp. NPDC023714 TaxID=3154322 RepID=UPI003409208E
MSLLDDFMLLAHDRQGRRKADSTRLDYGLGGAVLMELALTGRIDVVDKRVVVLDRTPTGDPIVDDALRQIDGDPKGRKAGHWVKKLAKGTRKRVLARLVGTEVLEEEHSSVLVIFPRTRYPWVTDTEPSARADARERMRAAILGGDAGPRTSALCALVAAVEMERKVFPELDRRMVKRRLKELSEGEWAAVAVRKAIQEVQAALAAASIGGAVAATGS